MERNDDEPARNQPDELYPEWTTHPHTPEIPPPVEGEAGQVPQGRASGVGGRFAAVAPPRAEKRAIGAEGRRTLATLAIVVGLAGLGILAMAQRRRTHEPVSPPPTPAILSIDAQLEEAAKDRLKNRPDLAELPVVIQVRDEVVIVSGRVPDLRTRETLLDCVRMTPSVKGVVDHTALEQPDPRQP